MTQSYLLEARALDYAAGRLRILQGIDLGLHAGEFAVLLGPSGCGKSTLLKSLAGILHPDAGRVLLRGAELRELDTHQLARTIGSVPQDDILHRDLRLEDALSYAARLRFPRLTPENQIQAAVERVLTDVELTQRASTRIRRLSGGQRKRANLGLELLLAPDILLLDEPTSGLDPALEASTMALLRRLAQPSREHPGRVVLTTTHATASIELADVLLVMVAGRIAWAGPLDGALAHFDVSDPELIFKRLRGAEPDAWARRYATSSAAASHRRRPSPASQAPAGQEAAP